MITTYTLIEGVKSSVISALNKALTQDYPNSDPVIQRVVNNIEMEYPVEEIKYPGIWVQFSFSEIRKAGITPVHQYEVQTGVVKEAELGFFKGTVTLSIVATTNIERDKIAGALINFFLFGHTDSQANLFFESMSSDEYIYISPNKDRLTPRGQTTTVGSPWSSDQIVYEDSYSFDILGQFASRFGTAELVPLRAIEVIPTATTNGPKVGEWV